MPFIYKSVDGDEIYFVHDGYGRIETEYGVLEYERGDYIVMATAGGGYAWGSALIKWAY